VTTERFCFYPQISRPSLSRHVSGFGHGRLKQLVSASFKFGRNPGFLPSSFHLISTFKSNFQPQDWGVVLSLGEQQRVAFARCFYMEPTVVILDESTSALDPENEDLMYDLASASFCSDATFASP
jgi:ABC-type branched-subunit amino acid transport system ATPase component